MRTSHLLAVISFASQRVKLSGPRVAHVGFLILPCQIRGNVRFDSAALIAAPDPEITAARGLRTLVIPAVNAYVTGQYQGRGFPEGPGGLGANRENNTMEIGPPQQADLRGVTGLVKGGFR